MTTPNPIKEIKTTIIGGALFLISIAWFAVNFKSLNEFQLGDIYVPSGIGGLGILFLLAPDRFLDFAFGWAKKKQSKSNNSKGE